MRAQVVCARATPQPSPRLGLNVCRALQSSEGATSRFNCTCVADYYSTAGAGVACARCPYGGRCAGGLSLPVSQPGFFPAGDGSFIECPNRGSCTGDDGVCVPTSAALCRG